MIRRVIYFMQHGHVELAYRDLGEYVLANVRGALTVGLAVEKHFATEPSGSKSTTEASVEEKRVLGHHSRRVYEM